MNAAEIKTRMTDLDKAQKDNLPASHFIDILKSLEKIEVNEKLLRVCAAATPPNTPSLSIANNHKQETKVGVAVNKCKSHRDKAVSELANKIVAKWKKMVQKPANKPGSAAAPAEKSATPTPTTTSAKSPSVPVEAAKQKSATPASNGSAAASTGGSKGARSKETDKVNYNVIGDKVRDNCIGLLYDGLCFESDAGMPIIHIQQVLD